MKGWSASRLGVVSGVEGSQKLGRGKERHGDDKGRAPAPRSLQWWCAATTPVSVLKLPLCLWGRVLELRLWTSSAPPPAPLPAFSVEQSGSPYPAGHLQIQLDRVSTALPAQMSQPYWNEAFEKRKFFSNCLAVRNGHPFLEAIHHRMPNTLPCVKRVHQVHSSVHSLAPLRAVVVTADASSDAHDQTGQNTIEEQDSEDTES
eukprot:gene4975-biopygen4476